MEPRMSKRVPPLTAKQVENFRPTDRAELTDGLVPGLRLRATASGVRSWSLNIRGHDGERRRFEVGVGLGLAEARRAAEVIRAKVRLGEDPSAARKEARKRAKDAREGLGTLSGLIDAYGRARGAQLRSWSAARALMRTVFAQLLDKPVLQLTAAEFHLAADICNSAYSAGTAVRYVRPILRWGAERGAAPDGLATALRPRRGAVTRRERVLSRDELHAVLVALGHSGYGLAARFLLLTAARLEEACGARWCEIDLDAAQWIIPGARRKNAKALTVPLSRQACELLAALGAGEPNRFVFTGAKGAKLQNWRRWQVSINERSGTSNWHRHDLRRSAATILGEAGVAPHIVETVLGHAEPHSQLASVYNKSKYLPEHRAALQLLADQLDEIAEGKTKIVRLVSGVQGKEQAERKAAYVH